MSFIEACIASCDTVKAMVPCFRWNALGEQTGQVRGQRPWMRLRRFLDCVLYNVPDYMPPLYNKNKQLNSEEIAMYGNIFWLFHIPQEVYLWKLPGDPVRLLNLMIEYELVIRDVHTPRGAVSHDIQERLLRQISYESENWTMYQDEYPVLKASNLQQITKVHLDKSPRFDVVYSSKKYYPNKLKNTLHPFFQKGSDDLTVSK